MFNIHDAPQTSATSADRKVWTAPQVVKIRAGDAELGANPVIPEGQFGKGS
ncbi:hypothetical protein M9980_12410 [Sphingomonas donggukensis]|uniref:Uncharacterized protein n=1 Tax=Sphingomonas donggukensis TaxID=2949093 RepID=A0ABY4TV20_9SPHN|nr:hypothetical protein [Sphingomonas donggukensis]URW75327.1 hypothetical protein M9980_12410 [Sphingomonas donggukensis]